MAETFVRAVVVSLSISVITGVQLFFAAGMFAFGLPRKRSFALRAAASAALVVAALDVLSALGMTFVAKDSLVLNFLARFATFSVTLALMCALVLWCFRAELWCALFCAVTGYMLQNVAAGLQAYLELLLAPGMYGFARTWAGSWVGAIACGALTFLTCYLVFVRYIDVNDLVLGRRLKMLFVIFMVVCVGIAFDIVLRQLELGVATLFQVSVLRLIHFSVCLLMFFLESEFMDNKHLVAEIDAMERLRAEEERQWRMQSENVEAINLKCHDIRHQIRQLGSSGAVVDVSVLESIAHEVDVYDSGVKTGNGAIDVILSEKGLICEREGIRLSCVVDGAALDFMSPADLYSLFGNALDNAIQAVRGLSDRSLRLVSLGVAIRMGVVSIRVENRYVGDLSFVDGLPCTTSDDRVNHGYGMRSMRAVAERYGGVLVATACNGIFSLSCAIPLPEVL